MVAFLWRLYIWINILIFMCWCSCCPWVNVQSNGGSSTSWVNGSFRRWGLQFPWHSYCCIDPRCSRSCYHVVLVMFKCHLILSSSAILYCVLSCLDLTIQMAIVHGVAKRWSLENPFWPRWILCLPHFIQCYSYHMFMHRLRRVAPIDAVSALLRLPFLGNKKFLFSWVSVLLIVILPPYRN